jgi:hypothetical protein
MPARATHHPMTPDKQRRSSGEAIIDDHDPPCNNDLKRLHLQ